MNNVKALNITVGTLVLTCLVFMLSVAFGAEHDFSQDGKPANVESEAERAADFLAKLGLIRGHLLAGAELYNNNLPALAETHMKHPQDEIYSELLSSFEHFGCAGFADELTNLTKAVIARKSQEAVSARHDFVKAAIGRCEPAKFRNDPTVISQVIVELLINVKEEFDIGVNVEGKVVDLHEYQDAWGFSQVALSYFNSPAFSESLTDVNRNELRQVFDSLSPHWPSLNEKQLESVNQATLNDFLAKHVKD